ncbi:MAG: sulfotransferase [Streptosporangiaceae bacterium]|nr:sulfotransferase [Streptosporangiaceae bacterium]
MFILTTSRSGSTLLRFLLDSHPDFACPPETGISTACAQLARSWDALDNADSGERRLPTDSIDLSPRSRQAIRAAVDDAFGEYLRRRGKDRWCDKSLDTYQFAELISQIYPEARFIVLTRHCMDVVASGVEACPWGLHRFGFDPFVAQYPGNSVAAVAGYWLSCTQANLAFAEKHPQSCHHVRYEDLVTAPEQVMSAVFDFLGVDQVPGITEACFRTPHEADGPGDEKIWFTGEVHDDSIGRGTVVPGAALPPPLRMQVNEILVKLRYHPVDDNWNAVASRTDPRADQSVPGPPEADGDDCAAMEAALRAIGDRMESRHPDELDAIALQWPSVAGTTVAIVVESGGGHRDELRWQFGQPEAEQPQGTAMLAGTAASWMSVLEGQSNLISEMTAGHMRCFNPRDPHRIRSDEVHAVAALLGLARIPVARRIARLT